MGLKALFQFIIGEAFCAVWRLQQWSWSFFGWLWEIGLISGKSYRHFGNWVYELFPEEICRRGCTWWYQYHYRDADSIH